MAVLLAIALMALSPKPAMSQAGVSGGILAGTVLDPNGAAIAGAKVTISSKTTAQSVAVTTNETGAFRSGVMAAGDYTVRVEAKGFSTIEMPATVQVGVVTTVSARLKIGREEQVVEVESTAIQVNTEQTTVQGVLTSAQIEKLPINGRNFLYLAQLEPGVQIQDGGNFDPTKNGFMSISFGGRFGRTARIEVDGIDISDETVGTTTQNIPQSGIKEFQVAQSSLDVSTELTSSGTVNVVTKSGTNTYHGEAFYYFRDSSQAAHLPGPPSPFQRNQVGGSLGGYLVKDKLYFFADGEHTLQHLQAPQVFTDVFSGLTGTSGSPFHETLVLGKLDWQIKPGNYHLFYRFSYNQNSNVLAFIPNSYQPFANKDNTPAHVVGLDFISGNFTHSIRFGYMKFRNGIVDASSSVGGIFNPAPSVELEIGDPFGFCVGGGEAFCSGTPLLAPQKTFQSNKQIKYDGAWLHHNHTLRFGFDVNRILGGGFAGFLANGPSVGSAFTPATIAAAALGPLPGGSSNPLNYAAENVILGNGQGFTTESSGFGFPAGGQFAWRGGIYIGDVWRARPNLTINAALRWNLDTGRTDSDLGGIPCSAAPAPPPGCSGLLIDNLVPGLGGRVRQPSTDFSPQLGFAWDPWKNGKTVIRAGAGIYYENVIFNNVLFDRPARLQNGIFLSFAAACVGGSAVPVQIPGGPLVTPDFCGLPIGSPDPGNPALAVWQAAAALQAQFAAASATVGAGPNPSFIGNLLCNGSNCSGDTMFAPNFRTPRSFQFNIGVQRELHPGTVLSVDYVRNVSTHYLLANDVNHVGDSRFLDVAGAQNAITTTLGFCGQATINAAIVTCPTDPLGPGDPNFGSYVPRPLNITDLASNGLDSGATFCGGFPCGPGVAAFPGMNPNWGQMFMLFPAGRSVYNALLVSLRSNLNKPMPGVKSANIEVSYALSRLNGMARDQDFINNAFDFRNPTRYFGPSSLDRTHQFSFGVVATGPVGFQLSLIGHFYSPQAQTLTLPATGGAGDIFFSDLTGDGTTGDILTGTNIGSFGRSVNGSNINNTINNFNSTSVNTLSPAGQALVSAGLFTQAQLVALGGTIGTGCLDPVGCPVPLAPTGQVSLGWLKTFDMQLSRPIKLGERFILEPKVGFYNFFNFANFDSTALLLSGTLSGTGGTANGTVFAGRPDRIGVGSGIFSQGQPRVIEWSLRLTF